MKKLIPLLAVFLVLTTCSGINGVGQLMVDAGQLLADAGDGNAQTAPARVLTADTDASRLESGIALINGGTAIVVVTGPVVMTRWTTTGVASASNPQVWVVPEASICDAAATGVSATPGYNDGMTGFFVRGGQKLCAANAFGTVLWAGYRPY